MEPNEGGRVCFGCGSDRIEDEGAYAFRCHDCGHAWHENPRVAE